MPPSETSLSIKKTFNMETSNRSGGLSQPAFLTTKHAAIYLSLSHRTLEDWRLRGGGPLYRKLGGAVRYGKHDLDEFVNLGARHNTGLAIAA